jgi:hypothetical protein
MRGSLGGPFAAPDLPFGVGSRRRSHLVDRHLRFVSGRTGDQLVG